MGIEVASSFTRKSTAPIDDLMQVANVTARNAIASGVRWQGMVVHCVAEKQSYELKNGLTNSDWVAVGSGAGGGGVNLITNGDAEGPNPFTAYKDAGASAPVDGTGGTPTFVSIAISNTTPLAGANSFVITKIFGNPIGEGVSVPFTVQPAYKARMLKISFDYLGSANFEAPYSGFNSDITVWIYDVTAGKLIQPSNIQIFTKAANGNFQAEFQTDYASTDYRLILHCGTVNTQAWTFQADNFVVTPSQYVYAAPITNWIDYTPTITSVSGTLTNYTLSNTQYSRVGPNLYMKGSLTFTGSVGTWARPRVSLPSGLVIDNGVIAVQSGVTFSDTGTNRFGSDATLSAGTSFIQFETYRGTATAGVAVDPTQAAPFAWGSTDRMDWVIGPIKIVGWSSNMQVSDGYDARDLRVNVDRATTLTGINPNNTQAKLNIAPTTVEDTYSGWDAANNRVLIKSAKDYDITFGLNLTTLNQVAGNYYILVLWKNGVEVASSTMELIVTGSPRILRLRGALTGIKANSADYFELALYSSANHSVSTLSADYIYLNVKANQAPTTMSRGATVGANYSTTATTAYTSGSLAVFAPNTKISDYGAGGTYNTATGEFTASTSMQLQVDYHIQFSSASWTANTRLSVVLYKNGSTSGQENTSPYAQSTQSFVMADKGTFTIDVVAGDIIKLMVDQNSTSSKSLAGFAATNRITFKRAGG